MYETNLLKLTGTWKVIDYKIESNICECCGHKIKCTYVIENEDTKEIKKVGSECVINVCGGNIVSKIEKAINAIKSDVKRIYKIKNNISSDKNLTKEHKEEIKKLQENEVEVLKSDIEKMNIIEEYKKNISAIQNEILRSEFDLNQYKFLYENEELEDNYKYGRIRTYKQDEVNKLQSLKKNLQKEIRYF